MKHKLIILLIFIIAQVSVLKSQDTNRVYVGLIFGFVNTNHYNVTNIISIKDNYCINDFGNGSNYYPFLGINIETIFQKNDAFEQAFTLNCFFQDYEINTHAPGDLYPTLMPDPISSSDFTFIKAYTIWDNYSRFKMLQFGINYKIKIKSIIPFGFEAGPTLSYIFNTNNITYYKLIGPDTLKFTNISDIEYKDPRTVIVMDDEIEDYNAFQFGMNLSAFVEFTIFDNIKLSTHIAYKPTFTKILEGDNWYYNDYSLYLILSYALDDFFRDD